MRRRLRLEPANSIKVKTKSYFIIGAGTLILGGFLFWLFFVYFNIGNSEDALAAPDYCSSTSTSSTNEWIKNVKFSNIDNNSGASTYSDFTSGTKANVVVGNTYTLSVTINADKKDYIYAWIDWNQDGDYDDADEEQILATKTKNDGPHNVSVTPPASALNGETGMRVAVRYNGVPSSCGSFGYGEVEDYHIEISGASSSTSLGPGGVGGATTNTLWIRADAGIFIDEGNTAASDGDRVQEWHDQSSNTNHASLTVPVGGRPVLRNNRMNGLPVLEFDGANDRMLLPDGTIPTGNSSYTIYVVLNSDVLAPDGFIGSGDALTGEKNSIRFKSNGGIQNYWWNDEIDAPANTVAASTDYIIAVHYDNSAGRTIYRNGEAVATNNSTSRNGGAENNSVGWSSYSNEYWNGEIAEVIVYNIALNAAQMAIVDNYLSTKYAIDIDNDYFAYESTHSSEIAGIGRLDATNLHTEARGSGLVRISAPSALSDDDFLLWGHDNAPTELTGSDVPSGYDTRMGRVWRISETDGGNADGVGTVTVEIDITDYGVGDASEVVLLIDSDGTFANGAHEHITGRTLNIANDMILSLGDETITFTDVDFNDGDYFTLAFKAATLPIELVEFKVTLDDNGAILQWKTASEINNEFFTIERSSDAKTFEILGRVEGAGNSNVLLKYDWTDTKPLAGTSYYRIKQTDYDGAFEYSWVETLKNDIEIEKLKIESIYPNPFYDTFNMNLSCTPDVPILLSIIKIDGNLAYRKELIPGTPLFQYTYQNETNLMNGIYVVVVQQGDKKDQQRLIKK
ncbi:GEVED domain-containing protein [Fulvivirgaceae bacterium BMA10]|uniref:GEVED domain-containing protein n=1 Tax=Splendidivirga corallicola TaxID=3051826 RepID=A0ABT8KYV5_9BACT|nr:GEVED domain-containing protein [Fulvivirgaceae bacterium BMA10]